jgi:hypothetical protein
MSGFGAAHGADASTDEVLRWAREYGRRLIEEFAEGLRGARSVRRTERRQGDLQLARGDSNVPGRCEEFVQQRSSFLVGSGVVRPQERKQIAFGVVGNHLDDVSQVFALGGELDHGTLTEVSDLDALGNVAALVDEPGHPIPCRAQLFAEFAVGDFEAAHRRAALLGVVGRPAGDSAAGLRDRG